MAHITFVMCVFVYNLNKLIRFVDNIKNKICQICLKCNNKIY